MRRYKGIHCYWGLPGSGKSYELARWGLAEQAKGRPLWVSAGFELPGAHVFSSVDEFVRIPNGSAVCLDEAPLWLDARQWAKLDPTVLVRLTQIRKYGVELRFTAIHPSMVEVTLRRITFDWWEIRGIAGRWNVYRRAKSPEGSPKIRPENGRWRHRIMNPSVWEAFDTASTAEVASWHR